MLIDKDGYAKLTDFGLSKRLASSNEKSMSFCGTPEYMAPEIVSKAGHSFNADWWSFGVMIYEMVVGLPPFMDENRHSLYKSIQSIMHIMIFS